MNSPAAGPDRIVRWIERQWQRDREGDASPWLTVFAGPELAFRAATGLRNRLYDRGILAARPPPIPSISVGNLGVGGAGKTPFTAWLCSRLESEGRRPAILIRGYGSDEVMLHRQLNPRVPVFVGADRLASAFNARDADRDVVLLDDGFQHRQLARDLDLVLISAELFESEPKLLPRGPWREGLAALGRADMAVVTRKSATRSEADRIAERLVRAVPGLEVAVASLQLRQFRPLMSSGGSVQEGLPARQLLAVTSIANAGAFHDQLRQAGATVEPLVFRDHQEFGDSDIGLIRERAVGKSVIVTAKDAVKLEGRIDDVDVWVADLAVRMDSGEQMLMDRVNAVLGETDAD